MISPLHETFTTKLFDKSLFIFNIAKFLITLVPASGPVTRALARAITVKLSGM